MYAFPPTFLESNNPLENASWAMLWNSPVHGTGISSGEYSRTGVNLGSFGFRISPKLRRWSFILFWKASFFSSFAFLASSFSRKASHSCFNWRMSVFSSISPADFTKFTSFLQLSDNLTFPSCFSMFKFFLG